MNEPFSHWPSNCTPFDRPNQWKKLTSCTCHRAGQGGFGPTKVNGASFLRDGIDGCNDAGDPVCTGGN